MIDIRYGVGRDSDGLDEGDTERGDESDGLADVDEVLVTGSVPGEVLFRTPLNK